MSEITVPLIYYITRADRPGQIKIGTTYRIEQRLATLMRVDGVEHELTLVAVEPGGREVERQRHHQFRPMRLDGEWFTFGAPIIHHVMQLDQVPVTINGHSYRMPVGT